MRFRLSQDMHQTFSEASDGNCKHGLHEISFAILTLIKPVKPMGLRNDLWDDPHEIATHELHTTPRMASAAPHLALMMINIESLMLAHHD